MATIINKVRSEALYYFGFCLAFTSLSQIALADAAANVTVEELVVTAQMREENIQSIALAVGAYDKELIARVGASSLSEMEVAIPNINFGSGDRNTRGEIAIRGVGDYSRNIGTNARVAVYVDGVLTGRSSSFDQSLLDIERVEVLRGPQGTLAGTNALAGSIAIVTQKPNESFKAELLANSGSNDLTSFTGKLNLPITDNLFASILLGDNQQAGYIHNFTLARDLEGIDREVGKLKLRYVGVDNLLVDIGFDYLSENAQATNGEALANGLFNGFTLAPEPFEVAHDADEFEQRQLKGAVIEANYETEESYRWTSITGIRANEFSELSEEDYSPLDVAISRFDEKMDQFTQEFRFSSPKSDQFDYVLGAYFLEQEISTERSAITGPLYRPAPNASVITPASAEVESTAVFMHGNYYLSRDWSLTAGVRYVHEEKGIDYSSVDTTGLFVDVRNLVDQKTFNEWLPKFGINYQYSPDILLYSSVARGYKSGGWNADFIATLENFQFDPEYALNYELGAKSSFLDKRLIVNSSAFVTKFDDFQVFQFIPTQASGTVLSLTNAGKVTSQGLELEISAALTDNLMLTLNTAFTQARFDEFKDGGGLGHDYDGNYLQNAPKHSWFAAIDFSQPVFHQLTFYTHINYGHTGAYFSNPNNAPENSISDRYVANARLGLKNDEHWDLSIWIKNITNQIDLRQRSVSFLGVPRGVYTPPRSYGVAINYQID
jgi:iron complex outermembrane recepter protein